MSQLVRQGYNENSWVLTLPCFWTSKTTHVHKWLQKQTVFCCTRIIKEYFQDEAFWFQLRLAGFFWVCQKSTWQMEDNGIELLLQNFFFPVSEERWLFKCLLQKKVLQRNVPGLSLGIRTMATVCFLCMFCCLAIGLSTLILFPHRFIFIPGRSNLCRCARAD